MNCLSPISVKVKTGRQVVPCGRCHACLSKLRQEWYVRCYYELKRSQNAYFVTLTYNDENINWSDQGYPSLNKREMQNFFKILRKRLKTKFKYFIVGEYGTETHRPHYHVLFFDLLNDLKATDRLLSDCWKKGHIDIGYVKAASINYVLKYMIQPFDKNESDREIPFRLMSQKPPIGDNYITERKSWHLKDNTRFYAEILGVKYPLPRYFKEKIYSKVERQSNGKRMLQRHIDTKCELLDKEGDKHASLEIDRLDSYNRRIEKTIKARKL